MKLTKLLLCLMIIFWTQHLQAYCATNSADSTIYPVYSISAEGDTLATIKRSQQRFLTLGYLEAQRCNIIKQKQKKYIIALEEKVSLYEELKQKKDTLAQKHSIILANKDKQIHNLKRELDAQKGISLSLQIEKNRIAKQKKRKLLGWKIGTFTLVGVLAAAIPTAIILSR